MAAHGRFYLPQWHFLIASVVALIAPPPNLLDAMLAKEDTPLHAPQVHIPWSGPRCQHGSLTYIFVVSAVSVRGKGGGLLQWPFPWLPLPGENSLGVRVIRLSVGDPLSTVAVFIHRDFALLIALHSRESPLGLV